MATGKSYDEFCRIQNLHISQTQLRVVPEKALFCRIQNLHISQTHKDSFAKKVSFVEFKIYISLKRWKVSEI